MTDEMSKDLHDQLNDLLGNVAPSQSGDEAEIRAWADNIAALLVLVAQSSTTAPEHSQWAVAKAQDNPLLFVNVANMVMEDVMREMEAVGASYATDSADAGIEALIKFSHRATLVVLMLSLALTRMGLLDGLTDLFTAMQVPGGTQWK